MKNKTEKKLTPEQLRAKQTLTDKQDREHPMNNSRHSELQGLPMRKIAKKLGISLNEARRRKLNGTL